MRKFVSILFILLCAGFDASAQKFLDDLTKDNQGEGKVTVSESSEIDELVNGKEAPEQPMSVTATVPATEEKKPETTTRVEASTSTGTTTETTIDTRKKVMKNSHKTNGYRVQVFSGGNTRADRVKAEQIQGALNVYTHFYSPRWICRMGNYKTYAEAQKYLKQVKDMGYKQAVIVKGKISVAY